MRADHQRGDYPPSRPEGETGDTPACSAYQPSRRRQALGTVMTPSTPAMSWPTKLERQAADGGEGQQADAGDEHRERAGAFDGGGDLDAAGDRATAPTDSVIHGWGSAAGP